MAENKLEDVEISDLGENDSDAEGSNRQHDAQNSKRDSGADGHADDG